MNNGDKQPENNQNIRLTSSAYTKLYSAASSSPPNQQQQNVVLLPIPVPDNDESPAEDTPNQQQILPAPARPQRLHRRSLDSEKVNRKENRPKICHYL